MPRVTVLIGVLNGADKIERAIDSLLSQTVDDLELLVVDDGSTDGTADVVRRVMERDARVRLEQMGSNVGIARSLGRGFELARSPFVAIQDADDWSEPVRLERQLEVLESMPDVAVVGSRMREVDETGRELVARTSFAPADVTATLMRFNPIPNTSAMVRREAFLEAGGFDPKYRYANDYDLWLRLADKWRLWTIDEPLSTREMSGTNFGASREREQTAETIAMRLRTLRRRRTLRGASGLLVPVVAYLTPLPLKRARRRRLGQAPS